MDRFFLILGFLLMNWDLFSQAQMRKLPSIINHPSLNVTSPFMSFDGNALLFVSNSGQDGALTVSYTSKTLVDWTEPAEVPKHINTRLNFLRGYALSADGKKMYFTSAKSPVVGGYDIFVSELKGITWTAPENFSAPINSKANEASPSLTPDGTTIYFMRCSKMDQHKASDCKLFVSSKKANGQWEEPVELPESINTGNSQSPRIMADGETLIFSSDNMPGNKGGMDLYLSRKANGKWSNPVPLDFANTDKDDQYVSVTALGRYLIKESKGSRNNVELTEFLIPAALRPKGLMKVEGKITAANGTPIPAYISVTDLADHKRILSMRPAVDGSYFFYLREGSQYEISVDPEESKNSFFAQFADLTSDKIPQKEKIDVVLKQPEAGDELNLNLVAFKPFTATLLPSSDKELKRLSRLIKSNPEYHFEIQVLLKGFEESNQQSNADLTEIREETSGGDTATGTEDADSTQSQLSIIYYHNDRTIKQAETIINALIADGVAEDKLSYVVNAIPATEEEKKLTVKAVVRKSKN